MSTGSQVKAYVTVFRKLIVSAIYNVVIGFTWRFVFFCSSIGFQKAELGGLFVPIALPIAPSIPTIEEIPPDCKQIKELAADQHNNCLFPATQSTIERPTPRPDPSPPGGIELIWAWLRRSPLGDREGPRGYGRQRVIFDMMVYFAFK